MSNLDKVKELIKKNEPIGGNSQLFIDAVWECDEDIDFLNDLNAYLNQEKNSWCKNLQTELNNYLEMMEITLNVELNKDHRANIDNNSVATSSAKNSQNENINKVQKLMEENKEINFDNQQTFFNAVNEILKQYTKDSILSKEDSLLLNNIMSYKDSPDELLIDILTKLEKNNIKFFQDKVPEMNHRYKKLLDNFKEKFNSENGPNFEDFKDVIEFNYLKPISQNLVNNSEQMIMAELNDGFKKYQSNDNNYNILKHVDEILKKHNIPNDIFNELSSVPGATIMIGNISQEVIDMIAASQESAPQMVIRKAIDRINAIDTSSRTEIYDAVDILIDNKNNLRCENDLFKILYVDKSEKQQYVRTYIQQQFEALEINQINFFKNVQYKQEYAILKASQINFPAIEVPTGQVGFNSNLPKRVGSQDTTIAKSGLF
jgi:hypothetical protein